MRFNNCKFVINEKERKIICIFKCSARTAIEYFEDITPFFIRCKEENLMPKTFVGIATCSQDDEWNVNLGKRIAFNKMRKKYYSSFFKRIQHMINDIDENINGIIENTNKFGDKIAASINKEDKWIKEQIKEQ